MSLRRSLNELPNAAEMRVWMNELKLKCAKGSPNPTTIVGWPNEVESPDLKLEGFGCLGQLHDPQHASLEAKIHDGLGKVMSDESKRQIDNLTDAWLPRTCGGNSSLLGHREDLRRPPSLVL